MAALYTRSVSKFSRFDLKIKYLKFSGVTTDAKIRESEYSEEPEYPQLFDPSKEGRKLKARLDWYQSIRDLPTVAQKLCTITKGVTYPFPRRKEPRILNPDFTSYNCLPFIQYCTRTHVVHGLPQEYHGNVDDIFQRVHEPLIELIKIEQIYRANRFKSNGQLSLNKSINQEKFDIKNLWNEIMFLVTSSLGCENKHITDAEITENPRCESFWWHGDYHSIKDDDKSKPTELAFQFKWQPSMHIRLSKPLPHVLERNNPLCESDDVPNFPYHPKIHNLAFERRYLTSVPGFWNGDTSEFPFLTMSNLAVLHNYRSFCGDDIKDLNEAVIAKGILGSFGWLMGIATNLGFTPFDELTYPLTTQTAFTNGKEWWFFVYQMNTIALMKDTNPHTHRNVIWSSGPLKLYETLEDGVLKGVDETVFKILLQFLVKKPVSQVDFDIKPYLHEVELPEEERLKLNFSLKRYFDNRPDHHSHKYEVPTWHHVYKRNKLAKPTPNIKLW